jgi:protein-tyrosine-phosphatase
MVKTKILFVCSGNVFRSFSAEKCLKHYCILNNINDIEVSSAGISGNKNQKVKPEIYDELKKLGINIIKHTPKKLTQDIINKNDLIVSMGFNHRNYIKEKFGVHSFLFQEVCLGNKEPVLDNNESLKDYTVYSWRTEIFNRQMVRNICSDIPYFIKNYKNFV